MPTLNIFRGLPGSGKTTRANQMDTIVLSPADMYSRRDGVYKWSEKMSREGQKWAMEIFEYCLLHEIDITIAEVLPKIKCVMKWVVPALKKGYKINVVDCNVSVKESAERNVHKVSLKHICYMQHDWEPWDDKYLEQIDGEV